MLVARTETTGCEKQHIRTLRFLVDVEVAGLKTATARQSGRLFTYHIIIRRKNVKKAPLDRSRRGLPSEALSWPGDSDFELQSSIV